MKLPIIFAFLAMLLWGIGDFLIQKTIKKIGWLETIWWINLASFIFLLPFIFKFLHDLNGQKILWLVVLGFCGFLATVTHFQALKIGKLSVVEIILSFELPLTVLLGVLFLKNGLSFYQVILVALLFVGIILLSTNLEPPHRFSFLLFWRKRKTIFEKGSLLALATAFLLALTNFFTAVSATDVNPLLVIWLPWTLGGLICFSYLIYKQKMPTVFREGRRYWPLILIMTLVDIFAWVFFASALAGREELAIVAAITESYVVIAAFLAFKFNEERIRFWQYVGAVIAIVSSLMIGFISK